MRCRRVYLKRCPRRAEHERAGASVELDSEHEVLQAQLAEAYGAALAERDREIAELGARLADAGNGGLPR